MSLLELRGVTAGYGTGQVLFGIDLAIAEGEVVTLLGRNGMGKTTTVRAIMGLNPPWAGEVLIDGAQTSRVPALRHRAGRGGSRARGEAGVSDAYRRGKPPARRPRHPRVPAGTSPSVYRLLPPLSPSAVRTSEASSRAASSRWWRSGARS